MSNARILKQSDAALFNMPALDEELHGRALLRKAEEIQKRAYEEGLISGERAGLAAGEQMAAALMERLEKIIRELTGLRDNMVSALEPQIVRLAVAIAKKIIINEVSTRPEIIVTMVREALGKLQKTGTITIKINPSLHELFVKNRQKLLDIHPDIVFDVNSNVPLTGPLVISDVEEVVTDIDSLLSNVMKEMKDDRH